MRSARGILVAVGFAVASSAPALAQNVAGAGPCASVPDMTAERASQFLGQPGSLFEQSSTLPGSLAMMVRDLTMSRPESIPGMVALANLAAPDQLRAIGAGLGTAAAVCALSQPATAQRIQEAVLATNKPEIVLAYTSIVGEVQTEAVPDLPATGETTPGGGRGVATTPASSGGALPSVQANSIFSTLGAANRQSSAALFAVSPSN